MKRTIEIEDNLQELIEDCQAELKEDLKEWLFDNLDVSEWDDYYQNSGCDRVHEIVDSNTPIYNYNIDGLYYLYGNEFDEAYENAGIGDGSEYNHRQVTIYCYLSEKTFDYMSELEEIIEDFIEFRDETEENTKLQAVIEEKLKNWIEENF